MELRILQYIDKMAYNEELSLEKVKDKDRFIKTVKDIIDMGWDTLRKYSLKFNTDYTTLIKNRCTNLDYSRKKSIVKKFIKK